MTFVCPTCTTKVHLQLGWRVKGARFLTFDAAHDGCPPFRVVDTRWSFRRLGDRVGTELRKPDRIES